MKFKQFAGLVEEIAPLKYAYDWDNSGVTLSLHEAAEKVLVCLDVNADTIREAVQMGCDTILSHHPLLFKPVKKLLAEEPIQGLLLDAIKHNLNLYAAHTSFDCSPLGINNWLADKLGLQGRALFLAEFDEKFVKIVVYVPANAAGQVKEALFGAGAGQMGCYSRVSYETPGTGSFLPGEGARPAIGRAGQAENVEELRIECICPSGLSAGAVAEAKKAHPYEEPVIDVYDLALPRAKGGLGCVGNLDRPMEADAFLQMVKERLHTDTVKFGGQKKIIRRVACVGGSGGEFFMQAAERGADALVTGEAKYNHFLESAAAGILLVEAGHFDTEIGFVDVMCEYLQKRKNELQCILHVCGSNEMRPYSFI